MVDPPWPPTPMPHTRPRWLMVSLIIAISLVLLGILVAILAGGEHGPSRHLPGGDNAGAHVPPVQHRA
jgi:hypothetical protein